MVEIVLLIVFEIVKYVDILMVFVFVRRDGWVLIVLKVYINVKRRLKIKCYGKISNLYKCVVLNIYLIYNCIKMVLIFLDI